MDEKGCYVRTYDVDIHFFPPSYDHSQRINNTPVIPVPHKLHLCNSNLQHLMCLLVEHPVKAVQIMFRGMVQLHQKTFM